MLQESNPQNLELIITTAQLKEVQYLSEMDTAQVRHLAVCGTYRWFDLDEPMVEQNKPMDSLLVIIQGQVSISVDVGTERAVWLDIAGPGSLVDPSALLEQPTSPVSVHALTPVEAIEIPRVCLLKELSMLPEIGYAMMQQLSERLCLIAKALAQQGDNEFLPFSNN